MKQLIVNADDFGLTPGVTHGIIKSFREGIVRSTTVMMNFPECQQAAIELKKANGLGIGVHLLITAGTPILPAMQVQSLVDHEGRFLSVEKVIAHLKDINLDELRREWVAQIDRFYNLFGTPDHLDSHHFIHLIPSFFKVFLELAQAYELPIRFPLPIPAMVDQPISLLRGVSKDRFKEIMLYNKAILDHTNIKYPTYFIESFFGSGNIQEDYLVEILQKIPDGVTELMCHPGEMDSVLISRSSYREEREIELAILTSQYLRQMLEKMEIQLVNYSCVMD